MKISIIGPGIMPIPPNGWGAVEILIWDIKLALTDLGHEVQIINTRNPVQILSEIEVFSPDFVHIQYDEFIYLYDKINRPKAITSHFGYLERRHLYRSYDGIFNEFLRKSPNIFCLSTGIKNTYLASGIKESNLFLTPNGVNREVFTYKDNPSFPERSLYLAKIDFRKRQHLFQSIPCLWYAGNIADNRFNPSKNYLGEWSKETLYSSLSDYANLVLLSDGEAHPLVCMEALSAGLGVVVSEWGSANLDISKDFISVVKEKDINNINYLSEIIDNNRKTSLTKRNEIREYSKEFEWKKTIEKYYIPSIISIINRATNP